MSIDNHEDAIDVRDVIERFEALNAETDTLADEDYQERDDLTELLDELRGNGGDHQWEGDWYPVTLIRDSYFKDYAMELAEDIGAINPDAAWPANCIDWDRAARELQMDYTSVDYSGITYWYR